MTVLRESIRKFPKEPTFRSELRKELEKEGRYFEAIEVLNALVELEPNHHPHRRALQAAWTRLAHPIKARDAMNMKKNDAPGREAANRAKRPVGTWTAALLPVRTWPVSTMAAPLPSDPQTSTAVQGVGKAERETQEKPQEPVSAQLIKKHYEAEQWDAARLGLRRLWHQYSTLDQAYGSRSRNFRLPSIRHSSYYDWPANTSTRGARNNPHLSRGPSGRSQGIPGHETACFPL